MAANDFIFHFDQPSVLPPSGAIAVRGWVAGKTEILRIRSSAGPLVELAEEERPDVRQAIPDMAFVRGFRGYLPPECLVDDVLGLLCETGSGSKNIAKKIPLPEPDEYKALRLKRVRPLLRPGMNFRETPFHFDFLTPELRAKFHVEDTDRISEFDHAPFVKELMAKLGDEALVLDCGAGRRSRGTPNIINLEIVPYPSTDVLATNEQLPFKDDSFDLVISCAVLEHVRFPFEAAREIVRVTKPGGLIYADVPFLQPYHGYPSHYYNMTHQGLANLFSDACSIEKSFVPEYGTPVWTLTWFLNSYLAGLPAEERERFAQMKVGDLIGKPEGYLGCRFVTQLSAEKNLELASVTSLLAKKK
jgi:SAM-dependent methyltransferase